MKFDELLNASELREILFNMIKNFDREIRRYQTDVYLYVNAGVGELTEFINIGGNLWLNDDHYLLYADRIDRDLSGYTEEEWRAAIDEGVWDDYYTETVDNIIEAFDEEERRNEIYYAL